MQISEGRPEVGLEGTVNESGGVRSEIAVQSLFKS